MGRGNILPPNPKSFNVKMRMRKLAWQGGDYTEDGTYWGRSASDHIYWAIFRDAANFVEVFVRAFSRNEAKNEVLKILPQVTFFA